MHGVLYYDRSMDMIAGVPVGMKRSFTQDMHDPQTELTVLQRIVEAIDHAVVITDPDNIITYVNPAYERLTGFSAAEAIGNLPKINQSGHHDKPFYASMWQALLDTGHWEGEIWDRRADGSAYLKYLTLERVVDKDGEPLYHLAIFSDLTDRQLVEAERERLTHYDALTSLPNRLLFHDRLNHEIKVAQRHKASTGLILLNLNRYRLVNESFGFTTGDSLLREVSRRLENCIRITDLMARQENRAARDPDMVSRMEGDRFAFILSELRRPEDAGVVAERLAETLAEPFTVEGEEVFLSASMGIAIYPVNAEESDGLLKCAETAQQQAKGSGSSSYHFFSEDLNRSSADRVRMEAQMRRAIGKESFILHYQPKLDLGSGQVVGMEALVRWPTEEGGMFSPADFIPLAENTGLIRPLGEWILRRALHDTVALQQDNGLSLSVAVNLSARQFQQPELVEIVRSALDASGIDPAQVELELTESMLMDDVGEAIHKMLALRELGVKLAIDDFGTGYSSLAYLRDFPVNTLKIDQTFVRDLTTKADNCIITAVIGLGRGLGLEIVAEGVETAEQQELLRSSGCHLAQGYHIARPMALDALIDHLRHTR